MAKLKKEPAAEFDQQYEVVPIDSIVPHPDNPNRGDVGFIGDLIEHNGWHGACVVQRSTRRILVGEHRWKALRARGSSHIPVFFRDVDDVAAIKILLSDNEASRHAEMDEEVLDRVLASLDTLEGSGFDMSVLEQDHDLAEAENEIEVEVQEPGEHDELDTQYGVMVQCLTEKDQEAVFNKLAKLYGADRLRAVAV